MSGLFLTTALLRDTGLTEEQRELVDQLDEGGRRLLALLDALVAAELSGTSASPMLPAEQGPDAAPVSVAEPRGEAAVALRILLVEDNATNQLLAARALDRLGYRADLAGDGAQALAALRRSAYDVVLMDVQMPVMDGIEATRRIRAEWPASVQPHIIAMTAGVTVEDQESCRQAGVDDYIPKPPREEDLARALADATGKHAPQAFGSEPGSAAAAVLTTEGLSRMQRMAAEEPAFLAQLIDVFTEEAPELVSQMQQAIEHADAASLRRASHSLKSNAAEFGASDLTEQCRQLEALAASGRTDGAVDLLTQIEYAYAVVAKAVGEQRPDRDGEGG
jgi:CheY-like chemotaxis protein